MLLASPNITSGQKIPIEHAFNGFGCRGQNVVPILKWRDSPPSTQSYALTIYDPDAPTGSGWWHWVVYNLSAACSDNEMLLNAANQPLLDGGVRQALNDYGFYGYGGPCPPQGDPPHHYQFTVHALKVPSLDLPEDATCAMVRFMIYANSLASAILTAKFSH